MLSIESPCDWSDTHSSIVLEMAGVGIFFQQEPLTGKVYVANIVPGGSADRSGVIRINDVIVKVDEEDVQGQPLATLRNLILGKQVIFSKSRIPPKS